jgi:hypothetical protein
MGKRPLPQRAMNAAGKPWPQAPKPAEEPWKDPPGQPDPDGGPKRASMRALLVEAAADLRGGIGADPAFHFIESRLSEIATVLPKAVENSTGDLVQLLRALNEVI